MIDPIMTIKSKKKNNLQDHYVHVGRCEDVSTEYGRIILRLHETSKVKNLYIIPNMKNLKIKVENTNNHYSLNGKEWSVKEYFLNLIESHIHRDKCNQFIHT